MDSSAADQQKLVSAWRSPWVIAWIALVIAVLAVNLTMVYFAIATNPGLVVEDYYERGQYFERNVVSETAEDPGWEMRADIPADITAGNPTVVRFFLVDKTGQPVVPDGVDFFAYRPSDASRDFHSAMAVEGIGRYMVEVTFPLIGIWDTFVAVRSGEEEYTLSKRVNVQRP
jgi:nitrogen fixation protein FixH